VTYEVGSNMEPQPASDASLPVTDDRALRLSKVGENFVIDKDKPDQAPRRALVATGPVKRPSGAKIERKKRRKDFYDAPAGPTLPVKVENPVLLADPDGQFIVFDGLNIHYKLTAKPTQDSLTLVLMHGFSGNLTNFNTVWDSLASVDQLLAFDRPGWYPAL
jgi:hypothetical protein